MKFPLRSLANVKYDPKRGYLEMRGRKKERTLTVSTVKTFAQTLRMMALPRSSSSRTISQPRGRLLRQQELGRVPVPRADRVRHGDGRCRGAVRDEPASSSASFPRRRAARSPGGCSSSTRTPTPAKRSGSIARSSARGPTRSRFRWSISSSRPTRNSFWQSKLPGCSSVWSSHNYWKRAGCVLVSMGGVPTRAAAGSFAGWPTSRRSRYTSLSTATRTGSPTSIAH